MSFAKHLAYSCPLSGSVTMKGFLSGGRGRICRAGAGRPTGAKLPKCKLNYSTRENRRNNMR